MKNQKGITLVALVVTIIVLLILAAVSLSLIAGSDGLLNKAANAVDKTTEGQIVEEIELAISELKADYYYDRYIKNPPETGNFATYLKGKLEYGITTSNGTLELDENDETKITYKNSKNNMKIVGTFDEDTGIIEMLEKQIGVSESTGESNAVVNNATVVVTNNTPVGTPIEYNIPYTDVYTGTEYTKDDGWLFLNKTEEENEKYTVYLMSAGIPALVDYFYNGNNLGNANNGWWGTDEQVSTAYPSLDISHTYVYDNGGYPNYYAAVGFEKNFENISLYNRTTWSGWNASEQDNKGTYTCINGESSELLKGSIFKIEENNVSVHNMTYNEAYLLGSGNARKVGTGSSYYWLASPNTDHSNVYFVNNNGDIDYRNGYYGAIGIRPVVAISGVTLSSN